MKASMRLLCCVLCVGAAVALAPEAGKATSYKTASEPASRADTSAANPLFALTWHPVPDSAEHLTPFVWVNQQAEQLTETLGRDKAREILQRPAGRRALFFKRLPSRLMGLRASGAYADRTIFTQLRERLEGEERRSIRVAPLPYDLDAGHELIIADPAAESGSGAAWAYLSEPVRQGDTTLPITDKWGGVHITAQKGAHVLSNFQSPWLDHATAQIRQGMQRFMRGFVEAGGRLDYLILDFEGGIRTWEHCGTGLFTAIAHDPRWDDPTEGFSGRSLKEQLAPHPVHDVCDSGVGGSGYLHWNALQFEVTAHALNDAIFNVAQAHFPALKGSNYWHSGVTEHEAHNAPNNNGRFQHKPAIVGTHGSSNFYGNIRRLAGKARELGQVNAYGRHSFSALRWMVKRARAMWRSNEGRVMPWIAFPEWPESNFPGTPYYDELIYHLALTGSGPLLFWNPHGQDWNTYGVESDARQEMRVDAILAEVERQIEKEQGYGKLATRGEIPWDSKVIATAVKTASGSALWRVSVPRVDPTDRRPVDVIIRREGQPTGDSLTVRGGEAGTWYVHPDPEALLTFEPTHPSVRNLVESDNLQASVWAPLRDTEGEVRYFDDSDAYGWARSSEAELSEGGLFHAPISVESGAYYTFSVWVRSAGQVRLHIVSEDADQSIADSSFDTARLGSEWNRIRITFRVPDRISAVRPGFSGKEIQVRRPMLNRGQMEAPDHSTADASRP